MSVGGGTFPVSKPQGCGAVLLKVRKVAMKSEERCMQIICKGMRSEQDNLIIMRLLVFWFFSNVFIYFSFSCPALFSGLNCNHIVAQRKQGVWVEKKKMKCHAGRLWTSGRVSCVFKHRCLRFASFRGFQRFWMLKGCKSTTLMLTQIQFESGGSYPETPQLTA